MTESEREAQSQINTGGGSVIKGQVSVEGGDFVGRDKNLQFGPVQIPFTLAIILGVSFLIVAVSSAVIASWGVLRPQPATPTLISQVTVGPTVGPTAQATATLVPRMNRPFNIAVAQFAQIDASGEITRSPDGFLLSQWVYEELKETYETKADVVGNNILIWHDSLELPGNFEIGPIVGDDAQSRRAAAAHLAQTISATMVIYGLLDPAVSPPQLQMEFYLTPNLKRVADLRQIATGPTGGHRLGTPLDLGLPLEGLNSVDAEAKLAKRSVVLFWLTLGLTYDLLGDFPRALEYFNEADAYLERERDKSARDLVNLMIGQQHLWLGELPEAETAFRAALDYNSDYARAQIGLGGVYYRQATESTAGQDVEPEVLRAALAEDGLLGQARDAYQTAVDLAQEQEDPLVTAIAQLALASTLRLDAEFTYVLKEYADAAAQFTQAIDTAAPLIETLTEFQDYRLLTQAYLILGAAHFQLWDIARIQEALAEERRLALENAQSAFVQCQTQRQLVPLDKVVEQIVNEMCNPLLETVQALLQELGD